MARRIGRYEITGKLGDGGFGTVYRGYDPTVERVVAIKILSTQGDASLVSRFRSEAMTAGKLHHRNIVTIYEFGEDNGAPFLAMEYLDGVDLQQIINNKRERESLTLLEKLEIMCEAAQGLQCAHENGVVHRDVKPANIMRLKDGSVKIMDFGIARLTNAASTRLTQTGSMIGTIYYMAPEQFKSVEVDALCDIWSCGVVFYELLTGIHPFRANDPAGVMYRITMEDPPSVSSLVPECPPALAANIHRLLSRDRHNRTQSLDDFLLDTEPVVASLAKVEIPELLKRAARMLEGDNVEGAQPVIGRLLKLDRSNKEARQLRERLRDRMRVQAVRPRIEALVREAEERAGNRDFAAALEKLNSAMQLDPGSPTLRSRLERIKTEQENARRADEAISLGRRSLDEGDLTGAFTHFSEALESDPGNSQGPALLEEVKNAMRQRELRAQIRAVMAEANDLIVIQAYDDAIALLVDLSEKTGSEEQVVRRLLEARQLKQAQETRDRLNAGINASRELLKRGSYEQASRALEELDRENPNSPAIEVLLTHARERLRAEKLANEIEAFLGQGRTQRSLGHFDEALQCVRRALGLDPTNATALALQRIYLDEAQADRDRRKIDAELEQYRALLQQEELEEALALVERLASVHRGEARVDRAKREVEERIESKKEARRQEVQKSIHEAERLLADARPDSATRLLASLTLQYPAEAAVDDLLDRARRLKLSQEAQDRLNAGLNSAQELLNIGNFAQACQTLEDLNRQYPQNPAVEVLHAYARERLKAAEVSAQIEKFLEQAREQQAAGRFDQARQLVERALELNPANKEARALDHTFLEENQAHRDDGRIVANLEKLQDLLKEQKIDEALTSVERLFTLFPENLRVLEAKRDISKKIHDRDQQRAREMQSGINDVERMLSEGRIVTATQLLAKLTAQFPGESSLESLVERARRLEREQALREEIRSNVETVREFIARREWDQAITLIGRVSKERPEYPEYLEQAEIIRRLRLCDEEISAVEAALKTGPLEKAISMAEAAMTNFPGEPRAAAALEVARNRRELNDLVVYARRRVAKGDLDEARQLLTDGRARFPDSPELLEIEREISAMGGLEQSIRGARQALQQRRFDEARKIVNELLAAHPANATAGQLREEIETQQREYERQLAYDRGLAEVEQLIRSLRFGPAIERIQQLLGIFPSDTALKETLDRACAVRDQHARREAYARGRAEAQALSGEGNLDPAIAKIRTLLKEFPGDATLMADLRAVQAAGVMREERIRIDTLIAELDALFRQGDAEAVRRGARELLSNHKEPRAAELLDWAERSITQTRQIRNQSRARPPKLLWWALAAFAIIALAAFLIRPPKRSEIRIQPAEIVFSYQKGGPVPQPQQIRIEPGAADQPWEASSGDSWAMVSIAKGTGTALLNVSVDPARLPAGQYTSITTVSSGSVHETLRVRLHITAPSSVKEPGHQKTVEIPPADRTTKAVAGAKKAEIARKAEEDKKIEAARKADEQKREEQNKAEAKKQEDQKKNDLTSPPLPPAVDCHAATYGGLDYGTIRWKGDLGPGEVLNITGRMASTGSITGRLPGCPVSVTVSAQGPFDIQQPSASDNFRKIRLTNKTGQPINALQINWSIK